MGAVSSWWAEAGDGGGKYFLPKRRIKYILGSSNPHSLESKSDKKGTDDSVEEG